MFCRLIWVLGGHRSSGTCHDLATAERCVARVILVSGVQLDLQFASNMNANR